MWSYYLPEREDADAAREIVRFDGKPFSDDHDPKQIAVESAEQFFHRHDGWECQWPLAFVILHDGVIAGKFTVDMDMSPVFSAKVAR